MRSNSNPRKQELTELKDYPKIFIIYTGGTVGQKFYENRGYCCCPGYLIQCLKEDKNFLDRDLDHVLKEQGKLQKNQHITGVLELGGRIIYEFIEYDPILDSSDIYEKDWKKMAADIEKRYEEFSGFVIIHGTDTMAFTASALSFMFENLTKPVVLTGSQIPIAECWNDAKLNLLGSMMVAAIYQIPEVLIFFGNKLLRGNRSIKIDNLSFTAFDSPNMPILGEFGAEKKIYWEHILKPVSSGQFRVQYDLETNITPLLMYPLITGQQITQLTAPPCKGLIIRAYGMGNFPARKEDVLDALKQAIDRGVLIVLGSQCLKGKVKQVYENTLKLFKMGVCTSNDMTFESQLCKLAYCFKKYPDIQDVKKYMQKSLRGEMSDSNFIFQDELEEGLQSNLKGDFLQKQIIFSIQQGYVSFLKEIIAKEPHIEFSDIRDYKGRPILHLAVMNGSLEITELLINKGCYVDKLDSYGKSAFYEAIRKGRFEIAEFLESKGGTLIANNEDMNRLRNVTKISINARVLWNKYVAYKKYQNL